MAALLTNAESEFVLLAIIVMMFAVNSLTVWLISRSITADELRLDLATSEERESIARDVHDLIGHSLTVVKLKAELAMRLIEKDPAAARNELEEIARLTSEAIAGVRGTVTGLRSEGLAAQLRASRAALESAGVTVTVAGDPAALSPAQSLSAAWILREATTNVLRHARATRVRVSFEPGTVTIEDDGVGAKGRTGNGVRGMTERASAAGATLRIGEGSSSGTVVSLTW
jgi:two-component system sensor histidine kinase DesK